MKKIMILALLPGILCSCGGNSRNRKAPQMETGQVGNTASDGKYSQFPMPDMPGVIADPVSYNQYLIMHYWDNFDFSDKLYIGSEAAEYGLVNFIYLSNIYPQENKTGDAIDVLFTHLEKYPDMYDYFAELFDKYLYDNPDSPMRNDDYYVMVLERQLRGDYLGEVERIRPQERLKMVRKNSVGTKASDFSFTTAQGKKGTLYGVKADYLLVFFYNLGCEACKTVRTGLLQVLEDSELREMYDKGRLKILAVYPDEDMQYWDKYINDIPAGWINAYDGQQSINNGNLYDLRAIPSLYLLDKDKDVILKDFYDPMALFVAVKQAESERNRK